MPPEVHISTQQWFYEFNTRSLRDELLTVIWKKKMRIYLRSQRAGFTTFVTYCEDEGHKAVFYVYQCGLSGLVFIVGVLGEETSVVFEDFTSFSVKLYQLLNRESTADTKEAKNNTLCILVTSSVNPINPVQVRQNM